MVRARQPATRAFDLALLRKLVKDLAAVNLADKHRLRTRTRIALQTQLHVEREQSANEFGARRDDVRLRWTHDFVNRRPWTCNRDLPGQAAATDDGEHLVQVFRQEHSITDIAGADHG